MLLHQTHSFSSMPNCSRGTSCCSAATLTSVGPNARALHVRKAGTTRYMTSSPAPPSVTLKTPCHWSSSTVSAARRVSVSCSAASRPMWAAKGPQATGGALIRMITGKIAACQSIQDLEDVYSEWHGSFDYIHTSAALLKCAKLSRPAASKKLQNRLQGLWLKLLPDAQVRACSNVLWACAKLGLGGQVWRATWNVFVTKLAKDHATGAAPKGRAQDVSNALWGCATLHQHPGGPDLQLLLEEFTKPQVLESANPQQLSIMVWAIAQLHQLPGKQGHIAKEFLLQLLDEPHLQTIAAGNAAQNFASVLSSLAHLSDEPHPLISRAEGQKAAVRLLAQVQLQGLPGWDSQAITNTMWALSELGLMHKGFMTAAVAAAGQWVPKSAAPHLIQAAVACVQLPYTDQRFMQLLLQQAQQLISPQGHQRRPVPPVERSGMAAMLSWAVALLDMGQLAGAAVQLVDSSGMGQQRNTHPSNLRRLWVFHSWLLQHQLLDGQGLTGVLTEQQLRDGEKEAAEYGTGWGKCDNV